MDQKVMELLSKIYQTQTETRSEINELRTDQETLAQNVAKIISVLEHDVVNKIGGIFDFRDLNLSILLNRQTTSLYEVDGPFCATT